MYKQKCWTCKITFKNGDNIVPILKYVENEKRGDFASTTPTEFVHAHHLADIPTIVRLDQKQKCRKCINQTRFAVGGVPLCEGHRSL